MPNILINSLTDSSPIALIPIIPYVFYKRVPDETNINLLFNKKPGSTSYGFLIPNNLQPDMLKNIDILTAQLKQKLLADQQGQISQQ